MIDQASLEETKAVLAVVPGGLTSIIQPLDVYVNKPLRTILENCIYSGCTMVIVNTHHLENYKNLQFHLY